MQGMDYKWASNLRAKLSRYIWAFVPTIQVSVAPTRIVQTGERFPYAAALQLASIQDVRMKTFHNSGSPIQNQGHFTQPKLSVRVSGQLTLRAWGQGRQRYFLYSGNVG